MAKATFDWQYHINDYVDHYADSMSLAEYAIANNLNRNSARRSMGAAVAAALEAKRAANQSAAADAAEPVKALKMGTLVRGKVQAMVEEEVAKKAAQGRPKRSDQRSDHPIASSEKSPPDQPITSKERSTPDQASRTSKSGRKPSQARGEGRSASRSDQAGGEQADAGVAVGEYLGKSEIQNPTRPKKGRGGARNLGIAALADLMGIDHDLYALAATPEFDDDLQIMGKARLANMYKVQGAAQRQIENDYHKPGGAWIDETGAPMPKAQALAQITFGTSTPLTELEKSINRERNLKLRFQQDQERIELARRKLELEERASHPYAYAQRIERTREIFNRRVKEGLSALETARLFEEEGIVCPASVSAEMLREVTWIEPTGDAEGGITPEELERQSREFKAHKEQEVDWLAARQESITQFVNREAARAAGEALGEEEFAKDSLGEAGFGANGYKGEAADEAPAPEENILADDDGSWDPVLDDDWEGEAG